MTSPTSEFQSSAGGVMIRVPAGSFTMGSPESEDGHRIWELLREVTLVNDFYLGKSPVTQDQYEAVTSTNPTDHEKIPDAPVDSVWQSATVVDSFVNPNTGKTPPHTTWMKALYDNENLYLAVYCEEPTPSRIRAKGERNQNSPGAKWDSAWKTRTMIGRDFWSTDICIPPGELGLAGSPIRSDFLMINLGREIWSHLPPDAPTSQFRKTS